MKDIIRGIFGILMWVLLTVAFSDEKEKEQMLSAECAKLFHINPL